MASVTLGYWVAAKAGAAGAAGQWPVGVLVVSNELPSDLHCKQTTLKNTKER